MNYPELAAGFFLGAAGIAALWYGRGRGVRSPGPTSPEPDSRPEPNTQSFLRLPPSDSAPDRLAPPPEEKGTLRALDEALDEALQDLLALLKEAFPQSHTAGVFFPGRGEGWYLRVWVSGAESLIPGATIAPQHGLIGRLLKEDATRVFEGDIPADSTQLHYYEKDEGVRSLMAVPIPAAGARRGALFLDSRKPQAFDAKALERLEGCARCAGMLAYYAYLAFEYGQNHERLQHFSRYQRKFLEHMSVEEIVGVVGNYMRESIEADRLYIAAREKPGSDRALVLAAEGMDSERLRGFRFSPREGGLLQLAFAKEQVVNRVFKGSAPVFRMSPSEPYSAAMRNLLAVPVPTDRGVHMVLCVESSKAARFPDAYQGLLLAIARAAGFALSRAHLVQEKEELASRDGLTGVLNHRAFQERFREALLQAQRGGRRVALLMIDIDFFKRVNDTYGHPVGDLVLQETARILEQNVRPGVDMVARYGGEEFVCMLPDADSLRALDTAERIRRGFEAKEFDLGQVRFCATLSIGGALFPDDARQGKDVLEKADKALYKAKEGGRNRVILYH